jgi:hypothetical protein
MDKFDLLIEEIFVRWQLSKAKKFLSKKYDKCFRMERDLAVNYRLKNNYVLCLNRSAKSEAILVER